MRSIWIDAEWFIGGEVFIIGYCYNTKDCGQLYGRKISTFSFKQLLTNVRYIYCYGPDVGVLEKYFGIDLRTKYVCVNLLKVFRHFIDSDSYKLADLEKIYGIRRKRVEYKKNIFEIFKDWKGSEAKRKRILEYNCEDAYNLMMIWKHVQAEHRILSDYLIRERLK